MEPNKVGKFILKLRKDNNLTQQEFADMFGVTYQAVSKWETEKNIPDLLILKEICKKFDVDINEILDGNKVKRNNELTIIIAIIALILATISSILIVRNNDDFTFKTITSGCSNFNIFGSIAFNANKSHIYISKIEYCGGDDTTKYVKIEYVLFESMNNVETTIEQGRTTEDQTNITLEEFLENLTFHIDNYEAQCKGFVESDLFLQIFATDQEGRVTSHRIPLTSQTTCPHN